MITMTKLAQDKIKEQLAQLEESANKNLRVYVDAGGCAGFQYGLTFDSANETDNTFDFDGFKVIVDPLSATYLGNANIDYTETLGSSGFSINNPDAKSQCGCGKSFSA